MSRVHFRTSPSSPSSVGGSGLARFLPSRILPTSFLGLLDLKLGASIITLFALFNKVVGVFGIIAVFHGGSLAQITLYLYSLGTIAVLLWGLRGISDEKASTTLAYANLFTLDHMLSTFWTLLFAVHWFSQPHDGAKPALAPHQAGLMDLIESIESQYELPGKVEHHVPLEGDARKALAQKVWKDERTFATFVLITAWLLKIYFALVLYSFALHLRHGTYHLLPSTKLSHSGTAAAGSSLNGNHNDDGPSQHGRTAPDGSGPRYHPVNNYSIGTEDDIPWSDDEEDGLDGGDEEKGSGKGPGEKRSGLGNGDVGSEEGGRTGEANGSAVGAGSGSGRIGR
ncbi:unnamed protein product [Tilletia controversa]|uniref:DUF1753-domain-containing protein n=1 Tax=Tilletia controversa TaxID=13291 RepID=A0A8X7T0Q7_9BASI|nr:hypothetical protein CF328_g746 [Tilletia controversa]KAE8254550.1 hypothetical protein A4X06_0g845 [Tilletia controversa]CAD6936131.1 unnamed protein product [Tilletia controversa]